MKKFKSLLALTVCASMAASFFAPVLAVSDDAYKDSLLVHYDMSAEGSALKDISNNGRDAVLVGGLSSSDDGERNVLNFTGDKSKYAKLPAGIVGSDEQFTVEATYQTATQANQFMYCFGTKVQGTGSNYIFLNPCQGGGQIRFGVKNASVETLADLSTVPAANQYNTVTAVFNNGKFTVYLNGAAIPGGEKSFPGNIQEIIANGCADTPGFIGYFGLSLWSDDGGFTGKLDDFKVYDDALTSAQVADEYYSERQEEAKQIVAADKAALSAPTQTTNNLSLPTTGPNGSNISWTSSNKAVIAEDGTITRQANDVVVTLTADLWLGAQSGSKQFTVTVLGTNSPSVALQSLVIPSFITGDLPDEWNGQTVAWSGDDAVASNGKVTRPAAGEANKTVRLTAKVGSSTITGRAEIVAMGGSILTYVSKGNDLLAAADSRRSDALHVAAKTPESNTFEELNKGKAILYIQWVGNQQDDHPNEQMGSPTLFRYADGSLGAAASGNNAKDGVYVWSCGADGVTFTNQRYIKISADGSAVEDPEILFDAAASSYKVFWTDKDNRRQVSVFSNLTDGAQAAITTEAFTQPAEVVGTLPENALETSVFEMNQAEYDAFTRKYGALYNTGVDPIQISTEVGGEVTLPETATMQYSDGSTKKLGVKWNTDELNKVNTGVGGSYTVTGEVQQDAYEYPFIAERADPHVFYNEDDGYYYSTGSYYEANMTFPSCAQSYRKLDIRRSKTIEGLKTAPESYILESEVGDRWGGFIWAPEFHKINGKWYCLVGAHDFGSAGVQSNTNWNNAHWCSRSILIPYNGTLEQMKTGGMLDKSQWGAPIILNGAPSFDVSYCEIDGQGYYVLPNTPRGAHTSIVKASKDPESPQFDGSPVEIQAIQWPWEYGIQEGSVSSSDPEGDDQGICEGAYLFEYGDKVYISYSGATVDKYYCLGLMMANKGSDIMDPDSWTSVGYPLLSSYDTAEGQIGGGAHVGGGHNSVVLDEYGNLALVYHARPYPDPHAGQSGAGGLFDPCRHTMVKGINVAYDGTLVFNMTADEEVAPENKTITATVTVTKKLTGLTLSSPPAKTTYTEGETLDLSGMAVEAVYDDSTKENVTEKADVNGYDAHKTGVQTITVAYAGKSVTFDVIVKPDKTDLQNAVDSALPDADVDKYTADSWKRYQDALKRAQDVLDNENATKEEVESALGALNQAKESLNGANPNEPSQPSESNLPGQSSGADGSSKPTDNTSGRPHPSKPSAQTGDAAPIAAAAALACAAGTAAFVLTKKRK